MAFEERHYPIREDVNDVIGPDFKVFILPGTEILRLVDGDYINIAENDLEPGDEVHTRFGPMIVSEDMESAEGSGHMASIKSMASPTVYKESIWWATCFMNLAGIEKVMKYMDPDNTDFKDIDDDTSDKTRRPDDGDD